MVVVDFFAEWCGPCKAMAPVLDIMSQQMEGRVTFVKVYGISDVFPVFKIEIKVDVDELEDIAMTEGVQAMPTFAFFKNGEKLNQVNGVSADELMSFGIS